jgi:hypothetical protein
LFFRGLTLAHQPRARRDFFVVGFLARVGCMRLLAMYAM